MEEIENARKIALFLHFLKEELKDTRNKLSDTALAHALNVASGSTFFDRTKVSDFEKVRNWAELNEQRIVLAAIDALLVKHRLGVSSTAGRVPDQIMQRYGDKLPLSLQQPRVRFTHEGDALGELASVLVGLWRLYYVSPVDRSGNFKPEIRSFAVFFQQASAASRALDLILLSGHSRWNGTAFVNDSHLYILCTEDGKTETAFFLTDKPTKGQPMILGLGAALSRIRRRSLRPASGVLCFGHKWDSTDHKQRIIGDTPALRSLISEITKKQVAGDALAGEEEDTIRKALDTTFRDLDELRAVDPALHDLVKEIRVNKRKNNTMEDWLQVEWP